MRPSSKLVAYSSRHSILPRMPGAAVKSVDLTGLAKDQVADFATEAWEVGLPTRDSLLEGRKAAKDAAPNFSPHFRADLDSSAAQVAGQLAAGEQRAFSVGSPGTGGPTGSPSAGDPYAGTKFPRRRSA